MSLQRERTFILALLLILAAASWVMLIWQSRMMKSMGMDLTMGMGATLFLAIWVVMMIAMMFPTTAPELNPDEGIWNYLKRVELKNVCCHDLIELARELRRAKERLRHKREIIVSCVRQCGWDRP